LGMDAAAARRALGQLVKHGLCLGKGPRGPTRYCPEDIHLAQAVVELAQLYPTHCAQLLSVIARQATLRMRQDVLRIFAEALRSSRKRDH
jgi:hypothetical protein